MYSDDKHILKKLTVIVLVKIIIVFFMWHLLIKDNRVEVDSKAIHQNLFTPKSDHKTIQQNNQEETHDH